MNKVTKCPVHCVPIDMWNSNYGVCPECRKEIKELRARLETYRLQEVERQAKERRVHRK